MTPQSSVSVLSLPIPVQSQVLFEICWGQWSRTLRWQDLTNVLNAVPELASHVIFITDDPKNPYRLLNCPRVPWIALSEYGSYPLDDGLKKRYLKVFLFSNHFGEGGTGTLTAGARECLYFRHLSPTNSIVFHESKYFGGSYEAGFKRPTPDHLRIDETLLLSVFFHRCGPASVIMDTAGLQGESSARLKWLSQGQLECRHSWSKNTIQSGWDIDTWKTPETYVPIVRCYHSNIPGPEQFQEMLLRGVEVDLNTPLDIRAPMASRFHVFFKETKRVPLFTPDCIIGSQLMYQELEPHQMSILTIEKAQWLPWAETPLIVNDQQGHLLFTSYFKKILYRGVPEKYIHLTTWAGVEDFTWMSEASAPGQEHCIGKLTSHCPKLRRLKIVEKVRRRDLPLFNAPNLTSLCLVSTHRSTSVPRIESILEANQRVAEIEEVELIQMAHYDYREFLNVTPFSLGLGDSGCLFPNEVLKLTIMGYDLNFFGDALVFQKLEYLRIDITQSSSLQKEASISFCLSSSQFPRLNHLSLEALVLQCRLLCDSAPPSCFRWEQILSRHRKKIDVSISVPSYLETLDIDTHIMDHSLVSIDGELLRRPEGLLHYDTSIERSWRRLVVGGDGSSREILALHEAEGSESFWIRLVGGAESPSFSFEKRWTHGETLVQSLGL